MQVPSSPQDWLDWYGRVGASIAHAPDVEQALVAVTTTTVATVPGATWSSVTRGFGERFTTMASSAEAALTADRLQCELRTGPCLDAVIEQAVVYSGNLATDGRWSPFGKRAAADVGAQSVLSVRMVIEPYDINASLNIYSDRQDAFTEESILLATMLTTHAAVVVTAVAHEEQARQLQGALESNREIGMAMGVLMNQHRITRDEAFALLRMASQNSNRKLRDIATEIADTGTLSMTITPPRRSTPGRRPTVDG